MSENDKNNDGASDPHAQKPVGRVAGVNPDGSVRVVLDLDNPLVQDIVAAHSAGGPDAANQVVRDAQRAAKN